MAECEQCFEMSDGSIKLCYECLEKGVLQVVADSNQAQIEAAQRIKELEGEIQDVSNQLFDLYNICNETTKPEVYGTILGLHERLEQALRKKVK